MRLSCRFILANQLKPEHLSYIVLPEKVPWQMRGYKNASEVHALLPAFLQRPLEPYKKRDVASYLERLKGELKKGQSVALSMSPHSSPVSATQLSSMPLLAKKVAELQEAPVTYRKANYAPITDNTTLARTITYVPTEPTPEHKIVVEFAGQWNNTPTYLSLGQTSKQHNAKASPKRDRETSHRSLATFKGLETENRSLYLNIPCSGLAPIQLKLADDIEPVEKDTQMAEWDNVLIPVLPVVKNSSGMALRDQGYIYVVWNNKVWRELAIQPNGYFRDINLDYYQQKELTFRHLNIDLSTVLNDHHYGSEPFEIKQNGKVVCRSELSENETERVFGLVEKEVELVFPHLDREPITLKTLSSPHRVDQGNQRKPDGVPLPHIWVPYKLKGEVQDSLFLHYSEQALSNDQVMALEADPVSCAIPLSELSHYSESQAFSESGDKVLCLSHPAQGASGGALLNAQHKTNIAGVNLPNSGGLVIEYRKELAVDEPDDFFELKNAQFEWSSRAYFRSAATNEQGNLMLRFAAPPPEVKQVDIFRAAHSDHGRGAQHYVLVEANVPVSELIG
ncbi:hypothetical protein GCM10007938_36650 [Vibrio zhanjiangensis]|uniref:Uncharacterized protein n=1 Tax=Vibrio zhanjiangensis TaxID=1046128 RepID=A0ABQ6F2Z0_9VIBR|nr:hypothetical protein [Vibrio zhanjiangensis]GLT19882.1 hypothetical protein GCM10007938_36650 [Vibrio zhanjiangensis]